MHSYSPSSLLRSSLVMGNSLPAILQQADMTMTNLSLTSLEGAVIQNLLCKGQDADLNLWMTVSAMLADTQL